MEILSIHHYKWEHSLVEKCSISHPIKESTYKRHTRILTLINCHQRNIKEILNVKHFQLCRLKQVILINLPLQCYHE